jgi:hypothetical protein
MAGKEVLREAVGQILDLARQNLKESAANLASDPQTTVEDHREDLERWSKMVLNKELSEDEMKDLIATEVVVDLMEDLKQKGTATARLDKFKGAVVDILFSAAFKLIPS